MEFAETEEQRRFRQHVREWLDTSLERLYAGPVPPYAGAAMPIELRREWQRILHDGGWTGLHWAAEYGGRGLTLFEQQIFYDECGRARAPEPLNVIGLYMVGPTIIDWGTEAQKHRYLSRILSGEDIWCQGFSEPEAGSDLASVSTRAVRQGDAYVVNGRKIWTSYGSIARYCLLLVRTSEEDVRHRGLTCLLLDMSSPGVSVRPITQITGRSEFAELVFDDVVVPVEDRIGAEGEGWRVVITTLLHERGTMPFALHAGSKMLCDELLELLRAAGLAGDPAITDALVDLDIELESLRLANLLAIPRMLVSGPSAIDAVRKLIWERLEQHASHIAMEAMGAEFVARDHEQPRAAVWSYHYLRNRGRTIEAGTTEVLKNSLAERVLGLPRVR
ncbi:MAG TPA: acyl-CoA dehydrogenase family protein [Egibacteraceae bacterium]|nr:acyl-CoA dehydrogenase family protein [Egibacteraceae bacterium]